MAGTKSPRRASFIDQEAQDWVASLEEVDAVNFLLVSSFPRKVFTEEQHHSTLVELGLAPQATLFVQVADDSEQLRSIVGDDVCAWVLIAREASYDASKEWNHTDM